MKKKHIKHILIDEYQLRNCVEVQVTLGNVQVDDTETVINNIKSNIQKLFGLGLNGDVFDHSQISVGPYIVVCPIKHFDQQSKKYSKDTIIINLYTICEDRPLAHLCTYDRYTSHVPYLPN